MRLLVIDAEQAAESNADAAPHCPARTPRSCERQPLLDLVEHVQMPTAPDSSRALAQSDLVDSTFKHDVIELLVRVGVPYDVSKPVPYGNSVYLRRAVS